MEIERKTTKKKRKRYDSSPICDPDASPLLLPSEALLVPFENRTWKTKAWARIKHYHVPNPLPCGDNYGVSINWYINSDYKRVDCENYSFQLGRIQLPRLVLSNSDKQGLLWF